MNKCSIVEWCPVPDDRHIQLAEVFHLLGDPTRLSIVLACLDDARGPGELAETLDLSPSLVSHHMRLLKAARLVRGTRAGKHVRYIAADDHVRHMLKDMLDHIDEDTGHD